MAQLGARFHGMEEVNGSNPFRSTKTFQRLTVECNHATPARRLCVGPILIFCDLSLPD